MGVEIIKPMLATPIGRRNGRRIWLIREYELIVNGHRIKIENLETDYASIPKTPITWFMFGDTAHEGAGPHDFGYRYDAEPRLSKQEWDDIFMAIMEHRNEPPEEWKRRLMYWAVRHFANGSWHKLSVNDSLLTCKEF